MNDKHRFSNSARARQQVIELAGKPTVEPPSMGHTEFRGVDWLMGRRRFIVLPSGKVVGVNPATLIRYLRIVLAQQATIMRRWFWLGFVTSFVAGIVAGIAGATWFLVGR